MAVTVSSSFELIDRASPTIRQIRRELRELQVDAKAAGRDLDQLSGPGIQRQLEAEARATRQASRETQGYSRSADRASGSTRRLEQRAKGLESQASRTERSVGRLDKTVGRVAKWGAITTVVGGLVNMLGALAGGAIELLPRIGDLAGAGAGLGAVYVGAGAAMGTVKLATAGLSQALQGNKKALADLTPDARAFVQELKAMRPELQTLRESAQRGLFGGAGNLLNSLRRQAPAINRIVASTSSSLGGLANFAAGQVSQPGFMGDLGKVVDEGNTAFSAAGKSAIYLGEALEKVMIAARPLVDWMSRMAVQESRLVLRHAKLAQESGKLGRYFDRTKSSIQLFGQIGGRVLGGLRGVFHAASGAGDTLWKSIDRAAGRFDRWANSVGGQNRMRRYFRDLRPELAAMGTSLGRILKLFADLSGGSGGMTATITLVGRLADGADRLLKALGPVGKYLGGILTTMYALNRIGALKLLTRAGGVAAGASGSSTLGKLFGGGGGMVGFDGNPLKVGSLANPIAVLVVDKGGTPGGPGGVKGPATKDVEKDAEKSPSLWRRLLNVGKKGVVPAGARALGVTAAVYGGVKLGQWAVGQHGFIKPRTYPTGPVGGLGETELSGTAAPGAPPKQVALDYRRLNSVLGEFTSKNRQVSLSLRDTEKALGIWGRAAAKAGDVKYAFADKLGQELLKTRRVNSKGVQQIMREWNQLPPKARASAAQSMLQMANRLEKDGKLPRGATNQLRKQIVSDYDQMGKQAADKTAEMSKRTGQNTKQAADSAGKNMGNFIVSVENAMQSGVLSTGQGMNLLLKNLNRALTKVGAKPLGQIQVVMMQNIATGKVHSIPGHGGPGAATGARLPGSPTGDHIPLVSSGGALLGVADGGELVVNRHTERSVDRDLRAAGKASLGQRVQSETRPHTAPQNTTGGRLARYAQGGRVVLDAGVNMSAGVEPSILGDLRALSSELGKTVYVISGYRSPAHSVSVGGFSDDPHTRGQAADIGVGSPSLASMFGVKESQLKAVGLYRPFYPASAHEVNHVQLLAGGAQGKIGQIAATGGGVSVPTLKAPPVKGHGAVATATRHAVGKATRAANQYLQKKAGAMDFSGVPGLGGNAGANEKLGRAMMMAAGWGAGQWPSLQALWTQESGWNANAVNPSSGAYGIPQALGHGHPYALGDARAQIAWGLNYIKQRYGSPAAAEAHERANNWYSLGGRTPRWGGWHANGVDMTVNRPTIFGAGDNGPERVRVTPSGHAGGHTIHIGRGAVQVNAAGGNHRATQQYVERRLQQFAEEVAAEIASGPEEDEHQTIANGR